MRRRPLTTLAALSGAVAFAALARGAGAGADDDLPLARHLEAVAPAIVVVQGVLKSRWNDGEATEEDETAIDARGAVVDPSGILVLRGTTVGGDWSGLAHWREENPAGHYEATPTDLKVLVGAEQKEMSAVVLLLDSRLDLAFLQVLGLDGRTLPAIDLAEGGDAQLGDLLVGVTRRGRGFDYAAEARVLYAASRIEKPRRMWAIAGDFGAPGLPVFDAAGRPVGVLARQDASDDVEVESGRETFLLPLEVVRRSLEAARKRVPEVLAKAAEEAQAKAAEKPEAASAPPAPEKPAEGPAPAEPAPRDGPPPPGPGDGAPTPEAPAPGGGR